MSTLLPKAKAVLILEQPFFASIFLGMPMIEDATIKTLATNGDEIRYNPQFIDGLNLRELTFVLAHETMHSVFQHMTRRGSRNANRWNIAADYLINETLINENVGTMPKGCLYDPVIVARSNGTTESIYDLLPEDTEQKSAGDVGGAMDEVHDAGKDAAEMIKKEAEMKVKIIEAANAAKMAGNFSDSLDRMVKKMTTPRTDWKAILRRFLSERAKTDYSYAKPKRRFLAEDIYLPSLTGERMGEVVVAVDCSMSITEEILDNFGAEITSIFEDVKPAIIRVIYFDSRVIKVDTFTQDEEFKISGVRGGGTAFSPIFEYIDENDINPAACVILTDLDCSDFGEAPTYPVLWASIQDDQAPFGEIVMIKE